MRRTSSDSLFSHFPALEYDEASCSRHCYYCSRQNIKRIDGFFAVYDTPCISPVQDFVTLNIFSSGIFLCLFIIIVYHQSKCILCTGCEYIVTFVYVCIYLQSHLCIHIYSLLFTTKIFCSNIMGMAKNIMLENWICVKCKCMEYLII